MLLYEELSFPPELRLIEGLAGRGSRGSQKYSEDLGTWVGRLMLPREAKLLVLELFGGFVGKLLVVALFWWAKALEYWLLQAWVGHAPMIAATLGLAF